MYRHADDPTVRALRARIEKLPINAAHRAEARDQLERAERQVGRTLRSVASMMESASSACRDAFARRRSESR